MSPAVEFFLLLIAIVIFVIWNPHLMSAAVEFFLLIAIVILAILIGATSSPRRSPCQLTTMPTGQFHCTGAP